MLLVKRKSNLSLHIMPDDDPRQIIEAETSERDRLLLPLRCMAQPGLAVFLSVET